MGSTAPPAPHRTAPAPERARRHHVTARASTAQPRSPPSTFHTSQSSPCPIPPNYRIKQRPNSQTNLQRADAAVVGDREHGEVGHWVGDGRSFAARLHLLSDALDQGQHHALDADCAALSTSQDGQRVQSQLQGTWRDSMSVLEAQRRHTTTCQVPLTAGLFQDRHMGPAWMLLTHYGRECEKVHVFHLQIHLPEQPPGLAGGRGWLLGKLSPTRLRAEQGQDPGQALSAGIR